MEYLTLTIGKQKNIALICLLYTSWQGANLIDLYQNGISGAQPDSLFQPFGIGDKQIVSHQLAASSQPSG